MRLSSPTSASTSSAMCCEQPGRRSEPGRVGGAGELRHGGAQTERDAGQRRTDTVVQVAAQPPPFLLARRDDRDARPAQVAGQAHPADGEAERPGELVEDLVVAGAQVATDDQAADDLAPVVQRHLPPGPMIGAGGGDPRHPSGEASSMVIPSRHSSRARWTGQRRQQVVAGVGAHLVDDLLDDGERVVAARRTRAGRRRGGCAAGPVPSPRRWRRWSRTSSQVGPLPPTRRPSPATRPV